MVAEMNWKASPPRIEIAATSIAAASLGGAVGFAMVRIGPLGAGLIEASCAGLLAGLVGWLLLARVDRRHGSQTIESLVSPAGEVRDEDVLLLDQIFERGELLLDDALPVLCDSSRVVRLFATHPDGAEAATPLLGPGEMIARIEDFLGQSRGSAIPVEPSRGTGQAAGENASAALHAALADIRRSLRQA